MSDLTGEAPRGLTPRHSPSLSIDRNLFEEITGEKTVTEEQEESQGNKIRGEETDTRPTTTVVCSECGHNKAYYEMKQIRAADESETRFFECVECGHKWREDDN